jgi:hypothetical protein
MLTRSRWTRILATAVLLAGLAVVFGPGSAEAGGGGSCPPEIPWCTVTGTGGGTGGGGGGTGGGSGSTGCSYMGHDVACYEPGLGYYNSSNQCYYLREDPQPAADDPIWGTHTPDQGAFYEVTCFTGPPPWGSGQVEPGEEWINRPAAGPTPVDLANAALAKIRLDGPAIHMAPTPTGVGGLVGLPVWMWTTVNAHTWGPIHSSASSGALTVNITAKAAKIVWKMGDGSTVTCTNPGTAYVAADGSAASKSCGYRYDKPSYAQPKGKYAITATTTWTVTWIGGGDGGIITTTRTSNTTVRINEQQVVVK